MGKAHQASRRRSYARRQHELRERVDRRTPRREDAAEVRDDAPTLEEPRYGSLRWSVFAWGGLH